MINNEIHRQMNFLASIPMYGNTTMHKKDVQEMLLETGGNMLACGRLYNFVVKDIGADIYRVSLELANP